MYNELSHTFIQDINYNILTDTFSADTLLLLAKIYISIYFYIL